MWRAAVLDDLDPAVVLRFDRMTPVNGPHVGPANPVRGIQGGSLPWTLTTGTGSLDRDGHLLVHVRGLVLAHEPSVPAAMRGTNPFPAFRAIVSCQSTGSGDTLSTTDIATGDFQANAAGDLEINARVSLPWPCIAPMVFITGPSGVTGWLAATEG
jgi:hypothetical protein